MPLRLEGDPDGFEGVQPKPYYVCRQSGMSFSWAIVVEQAFVKRAPLCESLLPSNRRGRFSRKGRDSAASDGWGPCKAGGWRMTWLRAIDVKITNPEPRPEPPERKIGLTLQQRNILNYVKAQIEQRGIPPTRQEIKDHFGWRSAQAVQEHLYAIERKGWMRIIPNVSRGLVLIKSKRKCTETI